MNLEMNEIPFFSGTPGGLKIELSEDLATRVINHRNDFRRMFISHVMEKLIVLRGYVGAPPSFDTVGNEFLLRQNYDTVFGKNKKGEDVLLGVVENNQTISNSLSLFSFQKLNPRSIRFIIPNSERMDLKDMEEITSNDLNGNFIVLKNKGILLNNDYNKIEYYADNLAEISASRFSLVIQAKVMTVIKSEINDETTNQIVSAMYNGQPVLKSGLSLEKENFITLDNTGLADNLSTLKREYENLVNELNNLLGINTVGIDKDSGVSSYETESNNSEVKATQNIYINPMNKAFKNYNAVYNDVNIRVMFNDVTIQEMQKMTGVNLNERERGADE